MTDEDCSSRTASVSADGVLIGSTYGIVNSIMLWFATFYVFNMSFPKESKQTLTFIQKVILGLKDKLKIPSKIFTLQKRIENKANKE